MSDGDGVVAADERGRLERQVVGPGVERGERREAVREIGVLDLEDVLGLEQVLEPAQPEVAQRDARPAGASRTSAAVAAESRIWPPCPAARRRAARLTVGP